MRGDTPDRAYSTRLRTALVLTGSGTAGAYHAGVLRALHEAGVRIDLVAGRGIGAIAAMFAAVDGGAKLWEPGGLWKRASIAGAYGWRPSLKAAGWALVAAAVFLAVPLVLFAAGVLIAIAGVLLWLVGLTGAQAAMTSWYARSLDSLFAPTALPTVLPRLIVLSLIVALGVCAGMLVTRVMHAPARRRVARGRLWQLLGSPLTAHALLEGAVAELWNLIRGAAPIAPPSQAELGRKYAELLAENLGQPGFRELLIVAHDMDAGRDVVFALLGAAHRGRFFGRPGDAARAADTVDLGGLGRDHVVDALAAALALPVAAEPHLVRYAVDGPWRGETHRLCDRPGSLPRLLEEVAAAGAEQVILLSAAPLPSRPHELSSGRGDLRGHAGEQLGSFETAALRDAAALAAGRFTGLYVIRPVHNPVGPLDFRGSDDERSDRRFSLSELVDRGYEDAYRQFVDPVVGASGERMEAVES
ncbi:MAG TPA: patatin-like phospholipase family protein [Vicinamibacterales bacterium]|nr:patatin-like phospholipase family protein [Vicinamibacterales bacterium]